MFEIHNKIVSERPGSDFVFLKTPEMDREKKLTSLDSEMARLLLVVKLSSRKMKASMRTYSPGVRAQQANPLHRRVQLNQLFCAVVLVRGQNHLALRGLSIQSRQYIFFESCMRFQFQGASVCLVLIRHDGPAIHRVYCCGSACRQLLVFWLPSTLYNL